MTGQNHKPVRTIEGGSLLIFRVDNYRERSNEAAVRERVPQGFRQEHTPDAHAFEFLASCQPSKQCRWKLFVFRDAQLSSGFRGQFSSIDRILRERVVACDGFAVRSENVDGGDSFLNVLACLFAQVSVERFMFARKGRPIMFFLVERLESEGRLLRLLGRGQLANLLAKAARRGD